MIIYRHYFNLSDNKDIVDNLKERFGYTLGYTFEFGKELLFTYSDKKDFDIKKDNFYFIRGYKKPTKDYMGNECETFKWELDLERDTHESNNFWILEEKLVRWAIEEGYYSDNVKVINPINDIYVEYTLNGYMPTFKEGKL
tara:strand:- start:674 stop:1096 length:423 start_codon:yes stop_codon:yes gene_type:complete